jgi:pimeloyl-ACP methyl ester carboxylesterase
MLVAFLPGFSRSAAQLAHWKDLLPAEVRLFDLPGHGKAPPIETPTLANIAERFIEQIPRDALIVGESLGGLVALKMAASGYRVVALEPPLSTAKLWVLRQVLLQVVEREVAIPWMAPFLEGLFGVSPGKAPRALNYWPLLDEAVGPVDVVAATEPLWPIRPIDLTVANTPSVLDEVDAYHLRRHPNVRFRTLQGPHTLLTESVEASRQTLLELIA